MVEDIQQQIATRMFERNLPLLRAIECGEIFSLRHEEYCSDIEKRRSMQYAPGCIIMGDMNFSLFMELLGTKMTTDLDDHLNKIQYFILVAVPELITKIVMDVYEITKEEAVKKKLEIGIRVTKNTPGLFD
ncbi:hypothetical protein B566_EDAN001047 [Ephemera danica]|nr:hypothetical protein B566_EDAN001047 [Ephemera danica]